MKLELFQVDAFTRHVFSGNPAAVVPLREWLPDDTLQHIAAENNLSETAFFVEEKHGYRLRWFTPTVEVDLCGHATLATAWVVFYELHQQADRLVFFTRSGELTVSRHTHGLKMNFPAVMPIPSLPPEKLLAGLGVHSNHVYLADDYIVMLDSEQQVLDVVPDLRVIKDIDARGVIVTARGNSTDFVSRWFGPQTGVDEDPVTGSAHTWLTPLWAKKLGKNALTARQLSKRGGDLLCELVADRVEIIGQAATYLRGHIQISDC